MARRAVDISNNIRAVLRTLDPDISADPLTPERKIIDSVAEAIAGAEVDKNVLDYQFDIDTKVGADLDKFIALFGFARQSGRRATGSVTFIKTTVATQDIPIPAGTQIIKPATRVSPVVIFQTTVTVTLYSGTTEVEVPIESTTVGTIGNVVAGSISSLAGTSSTEFSTITNENATTGGTNVETDAELRVRFKNTIFRNISGTKDQYLALAIASRFASKANIIGPISRYIEYIQIASNTPTPGNTGTVSLIPYSKYTYNFDYYLTDGSITNERFYNRNGVDYTFGSANPPTVQVNNATALPLGTVVLLEHSYCSINSRNDPATGLANYVDVFVSGSDIATATETALYPTSGNNFNTTPSSPYYRPNFQRINDNSLPPVGNRFQELLWQPVTGLPDAIVIGNRTFYENIDYWLVTDITVYKGSRRARNGIEWSAGASLLVTGGTAFTLNYTFDKLPLTLNELMESHKQVTSDVLVHSAIERFFNVNLVVMYTPGYARIAVDEAIRQALEDFLEKQTFGAIIQISDLLDIAHDVPGVDNVRLTLPADGVAYGVQEVALDGSTSLGVPIVNDFVLQDSDLPVLNNVATTQKSQNTWT